jgi:NADP-dependent 3-hydroxy acid dehydrogenase YdfG
MELMGTVVIIAGGVVRNRTCDGAQPCRPGRQVVVAARSKEMLAEEPRARAHEAFAVSTEVRERSEVDHPIKSANGRYGRLGLESVRRP